MKTDGEVWETDVEDEEAFRYELMRQLNEKESEFNKDDFEAIMNREISVFANNEKYDFQKDLKEAYSASLKTTTEQKIFATLPDHVFWDIKRPINAKSMIRTNRYNPFRGREYNNFFDMRASEQYMKQQKQKELDA